MLTPGRLRATRLVISLVALGLGIFLRADGDGNKAVMLALIAWGGFCLAYLLLDIYWAELLKPLDPSATATSDPERETAGLSAAAATVVQTGGVVLGLVAALATTVTPALKVGSLALVVSLLITLILYGWLISTLPQYVPEAEKVHVLVRYLFNVALMALAFGLIAVAMSIAVR
jgi:uncharacterized membrane protein